MSDLDSVLIKFFKEASEDLSVKERVKITDDVHFKKVAFDMYKLYNDHYDGLWKIEDVEGAQYLVRASDPQYAAKEGGSWTVSSNYDYNNVTLKYKSVPICSFSADEYGFNKEDVLTFKTAIFDMIESDGEFVKKVISSQPKTKSEALKAMFPELVK